ncbi:NADH dehydrogenase [ubiquinone] 1 alpha subcomplex subunit 7-like [Sitophilus oryzae]|uniref:NADH dehydrogenase [ubiquinone] 1 alpha subcomplex subunit 7 n=1 Tax=Sitophilus oryzae TaxID=7048 RepID=A0A6J2XB04_SITOR|nr:NADH dehydrogenase [ubiquinone] 1 alpha subcomplex subunit 7-like [Sitophilus oryzae]
MPPKPKVQFHDVNPFLQRVRAFLLGREHTLAVRFQDLLATRSPPPPVLPDGPAHKLSANYYFTRDARREVGPPEVISPLPKQIEASGATEVKRITPGKPYSWD